MLWWVEIMACTGVGEAKVKFEALFFRLLSDQILMIEDYAYAWTDFRGDPDLPLQAIPKILIMFLYFYVL